MRKIKELGEFGLIDQIRKQVSRAGRGLRIGIGDDTAVFTLPQNKEILFTTDMILEDRHFKRAEATPYQIGWKALAVNLSDIAAMGGEPHFAVVSLGLPKDLPAYFVKEMYRGMLALSRRFKVKIVGGDTNLSEKIVVSAALVGSCGQKKSILRSGAKVGDVVFVTGSLGGSYVSKKHLNFTPRLNEAKFLTRYFKIHAMMDISDGLSSDIHRLAKASGVGAVLFKAQIPVSAYANGCEAALTDGEDFELLFTLSAKEATRLKKLGRKPEAGSRNLTVFCPVGRIVERKKGILLVDEKGRSTPLLEKGFDHFK